MHECYIDIQHISLIVIWNRDAMRRQVGAWKGSGEWMLLDEEGRQEPKEWIAWRGRSQPSQYRETWEGEIHPSPASIGKCWSLAWGKSGGTHVVNDLGELDELDESRDNEQEMKGCFREVYLTWPNGND